MLGTFMHVLKTEGFLGLYPGVRFPVFPERRLALLTSQLSASLLRQRTLPIKNPSFFASMLTVVALYSNL